MRNAETWKPSRFIEKNGRHVITTDPSELAPTSRINARLAVAIYNRIIPEHTRGHFLDLGCGKAPFYKLYRPYCDEITCVDWTASGHGNPYTDLSADLSKPLPLADQQFDTILLSSVLEHLPDPGLALSECYRVLKPNGKLLMNVPFLYGLHEIPFDYFRYTEYGLRQLTACANLNTIEVIPLGGGLHVAADHLCKWIGGGGMIKLTIIKAIDTALDLVHAVPAIRKREIASATQYPSGYIGVFQRPASAEGGLDAA
ncbi:MAG: class I SAM-dependent methyltransferase [Planctomycetota bacterium]